MKVGKRVMTDDGEAIAATARMQRKARRIRGRFIALGATLLLLVLVVFIIILILALTIFKTRDPRIQVLSTTLDGIAPRVSFPVIKIKINATLKLNILVENRNRVDFWHGPGKSILLYQGKQVGEADLNPGVIPARKSTTFPCNLTVEVDRVVSDMGDLIQDILDGEIVMDSQTKIPGRVKFLKIFKKHVVVLSECRYKINILGMKIRSQDCKYKTKL